MYGVSVVLRAFTAATDGSTGAVAIGDPALDVRAPR